LIYVIFPFAIWASLRLEQVGAVTTIFVISGIAIWGTIHELGPFSQLPLNESLILLQTFTAVVSLTTLTLASSASERKAAESALRRQVINLEALNDASKVFLSNLEKKALFESICRLAVERLQVSSAWIRLKDPAIERQSIEVVKSPDSQPKGKELPARPVASFPLQYAGEVIGELNVSSEDPAGFSKEQQLLLESYANLAAVAIQNSWLFDQVRLGSEQLHALSHRLMEVQEEERRNLSRELHDESGQILSALMVRLGLLERDADAPDQIRAHVAELKIIVAEVLNNLHDLAVKLRPASLDRLGLITALQQYIDEYSRQHHLDVQFEAIGVETSSRLPEEIETAFFRIIQESLTNVDLHAKATRVDMLLNRRSDCLVMVIEDNGIGFNPIPLADENRLGLFGMRERVEMLGGKLIVESSPGKGTTISVEVPYVNSSAHSG
jgi:two-component system, NarL family, sensor histidine kinase NreB